MSTPSARPAAPQSREDIYRQRLSLIRNVYGDLFDAEFVNRAASAPQEAGEITLSDAAKIGRKTWQEKYGDCSMCTAGDRPEWSPYAKCFIHRHDKLDRRCGNNPPSECGDPVPCNCDCLPHLTFCNQYIDSLGVFMCPHGCGCLWRDNKDGTMSLYGPNSKSCQKCEVLPLEKLIPLRGVPLEETEKS